MLIRDARLAKGWAQRESTVSQAMTEHAVAPGDPAPSALRGPEPFVLRGIAADWPIVAAAQGGDKAVLDYLRSMIGTGEIEFSFAAPEVRGRFHYAPDMRGFNFERRRLSLLGFLEVLAGELNATQPRAIAAQGLLADQAAPAFAVAHPLPLRPGTGEARLWIGNRARVAAHSDPADNIAYCAAGRRRFTLFAPEQIPNLYLGPFDPTPAGTPIAMTDPLAPDFDRYPRFAQAMDCALIADLVPGDAIYIPYGWYHHVEALSGVSMLVNYWWREPQLGGSPWDVLLHAFLSIRSMGPNARRHWLAMLRHYAFEVDGDAGAHLPPHARGVLDARDPGALRAMHATLLRNLTPRS